MVVDEAQTFPRAALKEEARCSERHGEHEAGGLRGGIGAVPHRERPWNWSRAPKASENEHESTGLTGK